MVTPKSESYLAAIFRLQDGDERVATSDVAATIGVQPPTATKMLQRLAGDGLVQYERYRGTALTDRGERRALEVLRHHRLLELFLTERLGYDWAEVHEEADVLGHYISEKLAARIAEQLDSPTHDPHGEPIPTADLEFEPDEGRESLTTLGVGDVAVVSAVREEATGLLKTLGAAGVGLGTVLEVRNIDPLGIRSLVVLDSGDDLSLPEDAADDVFVCPLEGVAVDTHTQFSEA